VLVVKGPTDVRRILVLQEKPLWVEAGFMMSLYVLAFVSFFGTAPAYPLPWSA
jgi:hypothetical protein